MSVLFGHKGDSEPYVCGVCGRQAWAIGFMKNDKGPTMWLCKDDDDCKKIAKDVFEMNNGKLTAYENTAINEAIKAISQDVVESVLAPFWEAGKTNLNDLSGEEITALLPKIAERLKPVQDSFLRRYAASIKQQVLDNEIPY
jgi:hypothetical protein